MNVAGIFPLRSMWTTEDRRPQSAASTPMAEARATATSPSGWTAWTPVGDTMTGKEISWPITLVVRSRLAGCPATWGAKPIVTFPQKFYRGQSPLLLDLTPHPDVKFVRAHWEVARWGRGTETPMFEFGVTIKEIPSDLLREARAEAKSMA